MDLKNKKAFTLAEMMVVLLILSLVMAAFLPVITKKTKTPTGIWQYAANNADAYFGIGAMQGVAIGTNSLNGVNTRLLLQTGSTDQNAITFNDKNGNQTGKLVITGANPGSAYGAFDVGLGNVTLESSTIMGSNTAVGTGANTSNSANGSNVAVGVGSKGTGGFSVALGANANASGMAALAVGSQPTSTGIRSIAIGDTALANADYAIALGSWDGTKKTQATGVYSTAIGYNAIAGTADAIAIGFSPNATSTSTYGDVIAVGYKANATYEGGIAIGTRTNASNSCAVSIASDSNASGNKAIAIGNGANASANYSSALGDGATVGLGATYGIAIGHGTGVGHAGSVAIGVHSNGDSAAASTTTDQIVLGTIYHRVYVPGTLQIGTSNAASISASGGVLSISSDKRLKDITSDFAQGLEKIRQIQPINFTYKKDKAKIPHVGVVAQDLQKVFPDAVTKGDQDYLQIRQDDMFYAMINSIKQLDKMLQDLIARVQKIEDKVLALIKMTQSNSKDIAQLKSQNKQLQAQNKALETRIAKLEKHK